MLTDDSKNVIVSVRGVEPGLLAAAKKLQARLGRQLTGIDLVDIRAVHSKYLVEDTSGFFKRIVCNFDDSTELQQVLKPYMETALVATCRLEEAIKDFSRAMVFLPYVNSSSEASLRWCTQKNLMRDKLHAYDPQLVPKYTNLTAYNPRTLRRDVEGLSFPVIVKPTGLYASLLVSRCNTLEELRTCLGRTFSQINDIYKQHDGTGTPSVLVEEMMQGETFSIDVYVGPQGAIYPLPPVQFVTAHAVGLPGFSIHRSKVPTSLNDKQLNGINEAARAAVRALNLRATTAHIELFLTASGWKVIELGPRIGGCREALYREVYGIDHRYNDLLIRMGLEPEISTKILKHAGAVTIYAKQEGRIRKISGLEEAYRLSSMVSPGINAKVGDLALFADHGGEPILDAILSNADPKQLEADAARLREVVVVTVEPYATRNGRRTPVLA